MTDPVPYDSPESAAVDALANQLANCATFRSLVGAADVPAARAKIVETDSDAVISGAHAVIDEPELDSQLDGLGAISYTGTVEVQFVVPATDGDSAPGRFRRTRNTIAKIRSELYATVYQAQLPSVLDLRRIRTAPPVELERTGARRGDFHASFTISFNLFGA